MRIWPSSITSLPASGRASLQIPMIALGFSKGRAVAFLPDETSAAEEAGLLTEDTVEMPDEWFWPLKVVDGGMRVCRGREISYGFPHLTRVGYAANRAEILSAYAAAGGDPVAFDSWAQEFFAKVDWLTAANDRKRAERGLPV